MKLRFSAALILAAVLAACTPAAPTTPAQTGGGAQPGTPQLADNQKLVVGFPTLPATMDPGLQISGTVRRFDIFETLTLLADDGKLMPFLATEWKTIDPTTWRLSLRKDAKFHDGTPLTADDVVFSWDRVSSGALRSPIPGNIPTLATIAKVDLNTVDIKTKEPDPLILKRLYFLGIVPEAYVKKLGDSEFAIKPMGSGPFQFVEFRADDRIVVKAWPEHAWRKPKLTEVTIRLIPDPSARVNGLKLGELDLSYQLSVDVVESLKRDGFSIYLTPPISVNGMFLDTVGGQGVEPGPIANKLVRQAINYSIDRDTLAKTIYAGVQSAAGVMILPGSFGYNPDIKPYTYDVAKAKQLMTQAGYPNGFKTQMQTWISSAQSQPTALYVQSALKDIGIDAELAVLDPVTFQSAIYKQKPIAPIFVGGTGTGPYFDADAFLTWFWSGNRNFGKRFDNPQFDQLYEASLKELDATKRETLLKQAAAVVQEDPGWASLTTSQGVAAGPKTIVGAVARSDFYPLFDTVYRTK